MQFLQWNINEKICCWMCLIITLPSGEEGGVRLSGGNQQRRNCLGGTYPEELSGSLLKLSEASS